MYSYIKIGNDLFYCVDAIGLVDFTFMPEESRKHTTRNLWGSIADGRRRRGND